MYKLIDKPSDNGMRLIFVAPSPLAGERAKINIFQTQKLPLKKIGH